MHVESLILGTRGSALALWQANFVAERLSSLGYEVSIRTITTTGDQRLDVPLASIGEKGLFTKELDDAILAGDVHLAVHSLKDLPSTLPPGLTLAAVSERAMPFDAFVAGPNFNGRFVDLPEDAVLGTSSLRRQSQLKAWRPNITVVPVRGNVETRLRKLDESGWHGIILAEAGLSRLGLAGRVRELVPREVMLPAIGQGALGIVCAEGSFAPLLREALHNEPTGYATEAERAFLRRLEGGCSVPVGAYATFDAQAVKIEGCVASVDGRRLVRESAAGPSEDAAKTGTALAERLLRSGAAEILAALRTDR